MISMFKGLFEKMTPNAERAVSVMNGAAVKPKPRLPGDYRSELLVVGQYTPDGGLTLHKHLAYCRVADGAWMDDKTDQPIDTPITHWINASEQDKLF